MSMNWNTYKKVTKINSIQLRWYVDSIGHLTHGGCKEMCKCTYLRMGATFLFYKEFTHKKWPVHIDDMN